MFDNLFAGKDLDKAAKAGNKDTPAPSGKKTSFGQKQRTKVAEVSKRKAKMKADKANIKSHFEKRHAERKAQAAKPSPRK